jgi:hypothetical protein
MIMADDDHRITMESTFPQVIQMLAAHVGRWEDFQTEEVGNELYRYVQSLAEENTPAQVARLLGFLSVALGADDMLTSLDHFLAGRARLN